MNIFYSIIFYTWNFNNEKSLRVNSKSSIDSIPRYIYSAATGLNIKTYSEESSTNQCLTEDRITT